MFGFVTIIVLVSHFCVVELSKGRARIWLRVRGGHSCHFQYQSINVPPSTYTLTLRSLQTIPKLVLCHERDHKTYIQSMGIVCMGFSLLAYRSCLWFSSCKSLIYTFIQLKQMLEGWTCHHLEQKEKHMILIWGHMTTKPVNIWTNDLKCLYSFFNIFNNTRNIG